MCITRESCGILSIRPVSVDPDITWRSPVDGSLCISTAAFVLRLFGAITAAFPPHHLLKTDKQRNRLPRAFPIRSENRPSGSGIAKIRRNRMGRARDRSVTIIASQEAT